MSKPSSKSVAQAVLLDSQYPFGLRPVAEYRFHPVRKWRLDVAFPKIKLAVEVDGGVWVGGRHTRGAGYEADAEKRAVAQMMGWLVINITPGMLVSKKYAAWDWIDTTIRNRYLIEDHSCQRPIRPDAQNSRPTRPRGPAGPVSRGVTATGGGRGSDITARRARLATSTAAGKKSPR